MDYQIIVEEQEENTKASHNSKDDAQEDVSASARKGGLRTIPFILAASTSQMLTYIGIAPNMILYLINGYHLDIATSSSIMSLWSALSDYLVILGAFVSDAYFGRFRVIAYGSIFSVFGLLLLCLTAIIPQAKPEPCYSLSISTCQSSTFAQLALLFFSLGIISAGSGSIRPCSVALGVDQLVTNENKEKSETVLDHYFNWYFACNSLACVTGLTVVVYIQDHLGMKLGFGIPAIFMLLSTSIFLVGSPLYVKMKPQKSLFTGLAQVLVAAYKNRQITLPQDNLEEFYYHRKGSEFVTPSSKLRFLNKACIIRRPQEDVDYNGSATKPWELCSVDQVEALKALISIIPIWSTGFILYITASQPSIVLQASIMDRHITSNFQIPAGSFNIFTALTVSVWMVVYDQVVIRLIAKYTGRPGGPSPTLRIGIGLIISCVSMGISAIVENIRRRTAIQEGLLDDPKSVVSMSALWLIPQACLNGVAEGLSMVGQTEYYLAHLPKNMSSIAMSLYTFGTAVAGTLAGIMISTVNNVTRSGGKESWLSNNLNKGRYDYFYGLLGIFSLLNFVYFLVCCGAHGSKEHVKASVSGEKDGLKETLLLETMSHHLPA